MTCKAIKWWLSRYRKGNMREDRQTSEVLKTSEVFGYVISTPAKSVSIDYDKH